MAEFNGKKGRWVTVNGRHLFIEDGADVKSTSGQAKGSEKSTRALFESIMAVRPQKFLQQDKQVNTLYMLVQKMSNEGYDESNPLFKEVTTAYAKQKNRLFDKAQGKGGDTPEGNPVNTQSYRRGTTGGVEYKEYPNGFFMQEYEYDKDGNINSKPIKRISKDEYEKANGADHKKMAENDYSGRIADIRNMPEKSLRDVSKKEQAYIDLINDMKRNGYQGSLNKDYHDAIDESIAAMNRRHELTKAKENKGVQELSDVSSKAQRKLKSEATKQGSAGVTKELVDSGFSRAEITKIMNGEPLSDVETYKFIAFMGSRLLDAENFTKDGMKTALKQILGTTVSSSMLTQVWKAAQSIDF